MPDSSELVGRLLSGSDDVQLPDVEFAQLTVYLKNDRPTAQELAEGQKTELGRNRAKLKRILDFNLALRATQSKATQVATMTIGELLGKLGETEGLEQRAAKLSKQAGDGALLAGSREALHFAEACKLGGWATSIRTDLYANATVDKLRAKAAAETGQSKLALEYVRKLAGELAQRESIGYEAVKECLVGELLGRGSATAPEGGMSSNEIWVGADPKLLETLKQPSMGMFGDKQRVAALLRIIPDPDALNDYLQQIEKTANELLSMFRSDTNSGLMQTGIELADGTDQHVEAVRAMRDSVQRVLTQLRDGVVRDEPNDSEPDTSGTQELGAEDHAVTDDALPAKERRISPSRIKAKAAYDWATSEIPGAENMTIAELYSAIECHPSNVIGMLPPNSEAFGKYLRDAGVKRYNKLGKSAGNSVRRSDEL